MESTLVTRLPSQSSSAGRSSPARRPEKQGRPRERRAAGSTPTLFVPSRATRTPDESDIALAGTFEESPEGVIVPSDANVPLNGQEAATTRPASASGLRAQANSRAYQPSRRATATPYSDEWMNQPLPR